MKRKKKLITIDYISVYITEWMGSVHSIIIHTVMFIGIFFLYFIGFKIDKIMLILTTAVSLEAIYLSLFIQMTVNRHSQSLKGVEEDIDEIAEDVQEVQTSVEDIEADVDEISSDIDDIQADEKTEEGTKTNEEKMLEDLQKNISSILEHTKKLEREISEIKSRTLS